jgi:hypothetical protein
LNALFVLQASLAAAILAGDVARRLNVVVVDNWADMKTQCEAGSEVSLAQSFEGDSASYPGPINFSGKVCVIRGNGKTLDAGGAGGFFTGSGTGSSLEVHDLTLRNGNVSDFKAVFLDFFVNFPSTSGGPHGISLQFPAGHMERSSAGRCPFDSTRIAAKLGTELPTSECQLSFALLFSSIRALSAKRTISNFRSNSWRGTCNCQGGAIFSNNGANVEIHTSSFISNEALTVCTKISYLEIT